MFKRVKIGQDNTNELNKDVGVAEMCFIGRNRRELTLISSAGGQNSARDRPGGLYDVIDGLRELLDGILIINAVDDGTAASAPSGSGSKSDKSLDKLLYTYYPQGGYYRHHHDSVPNLASVLRKYSLLLYLNDKEWNLEVDGSKLRILLDGRATRFWSGKSWNTSKKSTRSAGHSSSSYRS